MTEVLMSVALFTGVLMSLTLLILGARALILGSGTVEIQIDGREPLQAEVGLKLHSVLMSAGIPIAAACGGRGTCGSCRVRVSGDSEPPLPTELALLDANALAAGMRLACQVTVRNDLVVGLPEGLPAEGEMDCLVRRTRHLTPLIKEITLELPADAPFTFRAGSFVQITCPPFRMSLGEVPVGEELRTEWNALGIDDLVASCARGTTRAYSLANYPGEGRIAMLLVRLALPPPGSAPGTPPGVVSSYLFGRAAGDHVRMTGPFGHFVASDSEKEMIFVGGGVGMAPMRAHIFEQLEVLHTKRKLSFWYGARTEGDIIYAADFDQLAEKHDNFSWSIALSEPREDAKWSGAVGFVHEHLREAYLAKHPNPAGCEYYLCGPPLMVRAVVAMLEQLGVDRSAVFFDDFGA